MTSDSCLVVHRTSTQALQARQGGNRVVSTAERSGQSVHSSMADPAQQQQQVNAVNVQSDSAESNSPTPSPHSGATRHHGDDSDSSDDSSSYTEESSYVETATPNQFAIVINQPPPPRAAAALPGSTAAQYSAQKMAASQNDDSNEKPASRPQHEMEPETKMNLALNPQKYKHFLLMRLKEAAPRGRLSQINLARRQLGPEDAQLIGAAIIANPQLSVLKLTYNNLGDIGAAIISEALVVRDRVHHQHLSVLDLGFNGIGDSGCDALAVRCLAGNFSIRTLFLSGNEIGDKGAVSIAGAILHGCGLLQLHLSVNNIGSLGVKAIAGAIAKHDARLAAAGELTLESNARRLQELHLANASLDKASFIAIPGMLLSNLSLRTICISDNNLDDQDMMLLGQALTQNKQLPLERLQLSFNQITCRGVECLMNAVWGSRTLREIKLDNNRIQDRGAQLCAVVLTSIRLEVLELSFNRVTTVGIKALMKNISENDSLQYLGLAGIPIDQNASKAISFALAYNTSLRTLRLDNCSTGYSSQRHIVAGVVSNRKCSLRVLSGFDVGPIAMTLGMPRLPEEWSNDQVLGFIRLMWQQWLLKSGRGDAEAGEDTIRGPAPPAAVAAAAKIAFASLGSSPHDLFRTESHSKPMAERSPVDSARTALLEKTDSGTMRVPSFSTSTDVDIIDWTDNEGKVTARPPAVYSPIHGPLQDPERRNRNLQWLRLHFRSLSDVGRLPFNNADLWQLHQYFFSPPTTSNEESDKTPAQYMSGFSGTEGSSANEVAAPPPTPSMAPKATPGMGRALSFKTLGAAFAASDIVPSASNKRRSEKNQDQPASKKAKNLKPRIGYYPRIKAKIEPLGTRPMEQTLSLLRQLKYAESIFFAGKIPYAEFSQTGVEEAAYEDIEMILLDLL